MTSWEKEKLYCKKRSAELIAKMEKAIQENNYTAFKNFYVLAMRYATKKELGPIYKKFLEKNEKKYLTNINMQYNIKM